MNQCSQNLSAQVIICCSLRCRTRDKGFPPKDKTLIKAPVLSHCFEPNPLAKKKEQVAQFSKSLQNLLNDSYSDNK